LFVFVLEKSEFLAEFERTGKEIGNCGGIRPTSILTFLFIESSYIIVEGLTTPRRKKKNNLHKPRTWSNSVEDVGGWIILGWILERWDGVM
jgi:hypothetical protein